MAAPTPKKPDTIKVVQTNMGLSLKTANPEGFPMAYDSDIWDVVQQNTALSDVMEGTGQYDQSIINERLAGFLKSLDERVARLEGFHYMITGAALQETIVIELNGELLAYQVGSNHKYEFKYREPIQTLDFKSANIVSVSFYDSDSLVGLLSCDELFKNCVELVAVDFSNKSFASVLSAVDMFSGCVALTTLTFPNTESWKPDLNLYDCELLSQASLESLIDDFLFTYDSGTHIITPNPTMWAGISQSDQDSIISRANAKGWQINTQSRYNISGTSSGSTVNITVDGVSVSVPVSSGAWNYGYDNALSSISFASDTNVQTIDFSLSDGLSGITSLASAFSGCTALTSVVFTNCDLSNIASALWAFSSCSALSNLTIPSGAWKPDVNFSDSALITYAEMLDIIGGLYTYATGTHTITFNQTTWNALTPSQQQTISDAADAKGWTTNAVMVIYVIRGTSTNVNGTETFNIRFIADGAQTPSTTETITCAVDAQGNWEYQYVGRKVYDIITFAQNNSTITMVDFSDADDMSLADSISTAFANCSNLVSVDFSGATFDSVRNANFCFENCNNLVSVDFTNATFNSLETARYWFNGCSALLAINLPNATFNNLIDKQGWYDGASAVQSISLPNATFDSLVNVGKLFENNNIQSLTLPKATFNSAVSFVGGGGFIISSSLKILSLPMATFASAIDYQLVDYGLFGNLPNVETIDIPNATFANAIYLVGLFREKPKLQAVNMPKATFANLVNARQMFQGCGVNGIKINMPEATFAKCTNAFRMFNRYGRAYGNIAEINMPKATFDLLPSGTNQDGTIEMFGQNTLLTTLNVPNSSTFNATCDLRDAALNYQSILSAANWLFDLSGQTAKTITFKTSVWNALSNAEQATIQGILQSKNWNLATA